MRLTQFLVKVKLHLFPRRFTPRALSSFVIVCWFGNAFLDDLWLFIDQLQKNSNDSQGPVCELFFVFKEVPLQAALFVPALPTKKIDHQRAAQSSDK